MSSPPLLQRVHKQKQFESHTFTTAPAPRTRHRPRDGKNNLHIDVLHHLMHRKQISMYSMYRNKKIDV
jgi:hypothetical protein